MASNSFGTLFRITTWGESHGKAIGAVIDGCPAGILLSTEEIDAALSQRAPGKTPYTSPRKEPDRIELLSGVYNGMTTGTPISLLLQNQDVDSSSYQATQHLYKPGHAMYSYLQKYGIFEYKGGGRASGRETACRVASGVVAQKILEHHGIRVESYIKQIGSIQAAVDPLTLSSSDIYQSPIFCPDPHGCQKMREELTRVKESGDSLGGIVEFCAHPIPPGLGDPIYEKLESKLAHAMLSIPASKGFSIGSGFTCASMLGSEHNDLFIEREGQIFTRTNHAGGVLGGISTGMPLIGSVAFKPPSSIAKDQPTISTDLQPEVFSSGAHARHDPCVAIRGVAVVKAMVCLVLADCLLLHRSSRL